MDCGTILTLKLKLRTYDSCRHGMGKWVETSIRLKLDFKAWPCKVTIHCCIVVIFLSPMSQLSLGLSFSAKNHTCKFFFIRLARFAAHKCLTNDVSFNTSMNSVSKFSNIYLITAVKRNLTD